MGKHAHSFWCFLWGCPERPKPPKKPSYSKTAKANQKKQKQRGYWE